MVEQNMIVMTPKEKAKDLVDKMQKDFQYFASKEISKQHALIAVDEIMQFLIQASEYLAFPQQIIFWLEVKTEIEKIK